MYGSDSRCVDGSDGYTSIDYRIADFYWLEHWFGTWVFKIFVNLLHLLSVEVEFSD